MNDLWFLAVLVAAVPVLIVVGNYLVVLKMSEPEKMFRPVPPGGLNPQNEAVVSQHTAWLASQGYQHLINFQFSTIQVAVFQQENAPRFFNLNFHKTTTYDLTTCFDDYNTLTTATSNSVGMFPVAPGSYAQGFPNTAADVTLRRHLEAESYLINKLGIAWQPLTKPYEQAMLDRMRKHIAHVRSLPLWPLRVLYWFFVTRKRMNNLTIQQQYP